MTNNQLILYCGLAWAGAAVVLIALDYLGNNWPKRRFRPRGWNVPRQLGRRLEFRRKVRAVKDEQVRETLEASFGTPTLALSKKRRRSAIDREPLLPLTPQVLHPVTPTAAETAESADDEEAELAWQRLEAAGWNRENRNRLADGNAPQRWNPITRSTETAVLSTVGSTIVVTWPNPPDEPFASHRD